jgi:hypothetical protein
VLDSHHIKVFRTSRNISNKVFYMQDLHGFDMCALGWVFNDLGND